MKRASASIASQATEHLLRLCWHLALKAPCTARWARAAAAKGGRVTQHELMNPSIALQSFGAVLDAMAVAWQAFLLGGLPPALYSAVSVQPARPAHTRREIEESRFQGSGFSGPRDVRERGEEHEHSSQTLVLARGVQAMRNPLR